MTDHVFEGPDEAEDRSGGKLGRPTILHEAGPKIVAALRHGADRAAAAGYAGVPYGTVRSWLSRGHAGQEPYASFATDVETAEAEAAVRMAKVVFDAAHVDHEYRAALEWLKRRRSDLWGDVATPAQAVAQATVMVVQLGNGPPRPVAQLSDDELALVEERLEEERDESPAD